ncbi:MAG TPA: hypothetical protein VIX80_01550, partial [Candidatus Kapabacteria bacterium]
MVNDTEIFVIGSYLHRFDGILWNKIEVKEEGTGRQFLFPDYTMFGLSPSDLWMVRGGIVKHYIGD